MSGSRGSPSLKEAFSKETFSKDSTPSVSHPRSSYDLTHQDSMTMLDTSQHQPVARPSSATAASGYSSPHGPHRRSLYHAPTMPIVGRAGSSSSISSEEDVKEEHGEGDDEQDNDSDAPPCSQAATRLPLDSLRRAVTTSVLQQHHSASDPYRSLAPEVHFDDVLREKSVVEVESGVVACRITVTGELVEASKRSSRKSTDGSSNRRRNNLVGAGEDDDAEGSVKSFTNLDDFLRDEERRRQKYDAAAAAHAVCMENAAAAAAVATAASVASDESGEPTSASSPAPSEATSSAPHGSEPLAQTPLWISVEDGDNETTELIGRYFGLHPLTIEDCQSKGIREKLEVFPEYLFLVFHALEESRHDSSSSAVNATSPMRDLTREVMRTTPLKLVVFPSLVLSFHKSGLASVLTVRRQLEKLYRNRVLNTAWLIHGLLDVVVDALMPVVDAAVDLADRMEDLVYIMNPSRETHKDVLKRMGFIARRLTFLRQRLWSKRDILTSLIEKDWQFFLTGVKVPYLRDIYDHLVIMLHKLDSAVEVIVTLQSTYLAVVSIDVAAVANDGNESMRTLSAGATILLPLSLVASVMGMNVMVPFDASVSHQSFKDLLPFTSICLCMVLCSYYMYAYFKKRQYL